MSSGQIQISVVVTTYNQVKYIRQAVDSILQQQLSANMEILIGEDCSTDGTTEIIKEYAEQYPDLVVPYIRAKNMGMSANTMDLVFKCKGKYIAFLEGDDYWIDNMKLQKQYTFLESHADYSAVFGRSQVVNEKSERMLSWEQELDFFTGNEYTINDFQRYQLPGQTCTAMYRKDAFMELLKLTKNISAQIKYMQIDRMLVLAMLSMGKMWNTGETVSAYRYVIRKDSGSWSSQNDYFSYRNTFNYLSGLKELEIVAKVLGLQLVFDERRKREFSIIGDHKNSLTKQEIGELRKKIYKDTVNKLSFICFIFNRKIRFLLKRRDK